MSVFVLRLIVSRISILRRAGRHQYFVNSIVFTSLTKNFSDICFVSEKFAENKTSLTEMNFLPRTNKTLIRGATLIHGHDSRALDGVPTYPRQLTYAHTSQNTRYKIFDCALSGPFDNLFLTRLSAPRALCRGIIAVISASTVSVIKFMREV